MNAPTYLAGVRPQPRIWLPPVPPTRAVILISCGYPVCVHGTCNNNKESRAPVDFRPRSGFSRREGHRCHPSCHSSMARSPCSAAGAPSAPPPPPTPLSQHPPPGPGAGTHPAAGRRPSPRRRPHHLARRDPAVHAAGGLPRPRRGSHGCRGGAHLHSHVRLEPPPPRPNPAELAGVGFHPGFNGAQFGAVVGAQSAAVLRGALGLGP